MTVRILQFSFCTGRDSVPELAARGRSGHLASTDGMDPDGEPGRANMPLIDIQLIDGVFDAEQKSRMIHDVTEAIVAIEGEAMRGVTWVRVIEIASGHWAIGGQPLRTGDVHALQKGEAA